MGWHRHQLIAAVLGTVLAVAGCTKTSPPAPVAIEAEATPARTDAIDVARLGSDLPGPVGRRTPQTVQVSLETVEVQGKLADGITYTYWTFGGTVPGPMVRVRVGDTVELRVKNNPKSTQIHSIDLHAVTGPGGGGGATQTKPGEETVIRFTALNPGTYVYHCATPHIPTHIALGMYGLIVVEPEAGFAPVDREFYVMQGELYTGGNRDAKGHLAYDSNKLFHEDPNYVVLNGQFQALTGTRAMKARVGDQVRIFVGNGGPNLSANFHVIGEVFDKVHKEGATETLSNVQTTVVPAGGAAIVEFKVEVPGKYILVDHSISRAIDKGALAIIDVEGADNLPVFQPVTGTQSGSGH